MKKCVGLVLAGGRSLRMGRDKKYIEIAGESFLARARRILGSAILCEENDLFISGSCNNYTSISDEIADLGPVGGIYSSLRHIKKLYGADKDLWVAVIPVDMPLLKSATIAKLIENSSSEFELVHFEGFELPLLIRCDVHIIEKLRLHCNDSKRSVRGLISNLKCRSIAFDKGADFDDSEMLNVNSLEDVMSLQS